MPIRRALASLALVSVGLTGTLAGCQPGGGSLPPEPVTVGLLADLTSPAGEAAAQAAQLAVELVNEPYPEIELPLLSSAGLPGLGGAPLALAVIDTTGDPAAVETAMERQLAAARPAGFLIADRAEVVAIAGAYADRQRVPLLDGATSAGFLLEVGLDWYFRITPTDQQHVAAALGVLAGATPAADPVSFTLLTSAPAGGAEVAGLIAELSRRDSEVTTTVTVGGDEPAAVAQAAALVAATAPEPVIAVAATAAEAELLGPVLMPAGAEPGRPLIGLGAGFAAAPVAGLAYPASWSADLAHRHPLAGAVADLYQQRYQAPLTGPAPAVLTAVLTMALALDAAASTDPAAVRAGLRQLSLPATRMIMPWHGLRFGDEGQNALAAAVIEQHTPEGPVLVYPPELATSQAAWPPPAPRGAP